MNYLRLTPSRDSKGQLYLVDGLIAFRLGLWVDDKEIDSLQTQLNNQKDRAMTLIYVKAAMNLGGKGKVQNYRKFFVDFVKFLGVFLFAGLLVYYGTLLLGYLLSLLGIKLPKLNTYGSGYRGYGGYSGYRGYGGYSYNEKNRKRKVKRIYRDRSSSDSSSEDNG